MSAGRIYCPHAGNQQPTLGLVSDEQTGRVTNSDLGRRVGNLEVASAAHSDELHEMRNQMNVLGLRVEHAQTLTSAKFEQVLAQGKTTGEQLVRVIERLDRSAVESAEKASNPEATPAGRQLVEAIAAVSLESKSTREWTLKASGAIALLLVLLTLFGPLIQRALSLPTV